MKAKRFLTIGLPIVLATTGIAGTSIALVSCSNDKSTTTKEVIINKENLSAIASQSFTNYSVDAFNWYFSNQVEAESSREKLASSLGENVTADMIGNVIASTSDGVSSITISPTNGYIFESNTLTYSASGSVNNNGDIVISGITFGNEIDVTSETNKVATAIATAIQNQCTTDGSLTLAQADAKLNTQKSTIAASIGSGITIQNIVASEKQITITIDQSVLKINDSPVTISGQGNITSLTIVSPTSVVLSGSTNLYKETPILTAFASNASTLFTTLNSGTSQGSTTHSATLSSGADQTGLTLSITSYSNDTYFTITLPSGAGDSTFAVGESGVILTSTTVEWFTKTENWEVTSGKLQNKTALNSNTQVVLGANIKDSSSNIIAQAFVTINFLLA